MTDEEIDNILKTYTLPKDELNSFSENYFGYIIPAMLIGGDC